MLVFLGCGFGGLLRYGISNFAYAFISKLFPYGTLIVNVSGSLLMGILFQLLLGRFSAIGPELRALLLVGFLGGYTTFSSFSMETINLLEGGAVVSAITYILLSVILCLLATWVGVVIGKQI